MGYNIYKIKYSTHSSSSCFAVIADGTKEKAQRTLEAKFERCFNKVYTIKNTGHTSNKKGIIFDSNDLF